MCVHFEQKASVLLKMQLIRLRWPREKKQCWSVVSKGSPIFTWFGIFPHIFTNISSHGLKYFLTFLQIFPHLGCDISSHCFPNISSYELQYCITFLQIFLHTDFEEKISCCFICNIFEKYFLI